MKNLIYPTIILLLFVIQSCETDIPETDTIPPRFTFRIVGDGFERDFNQDDDYSNIQLNLKDDEAYDFIYSGTDNGGVRTLEWQLPTSDYIEFASSTNIPNTWQDNVSGAVRTFQWNGDASNALTASILNGTFDPNGEDLFVTFTFFVSDFGGESGSSNTVSKTLTIYIGNHDTEIIEL